MILDYLLSWRENSVRLPYDQLCCGKACQCCEKVADLKMIVADMRIVKGM